MQPVEFDLLSFVIGGKRLLTSFIYDVDGFPTVLELITSGQLPVNDFISSVIPLERVVADGFERLIGGHDAALKILVEV